MIRPCHVLLRMPTNSHFNAGAAHDVHGQEPSTSCAQRSQPREACIGTKGKDGIMETARDTGDELEQDTVRELSIANAEKMQLQVGLCVLSSDFGMRCCVPGMCLTFSCVSMIQLDGGCTLRVVPYPGCFLLVWSLLRLCVCSSKPVRGSLSAFGFLGSLLCISLCGSVCGCDRGMSNESQCCMLQDQVQALENQITLKEGEMESVEQQQLQAVPAVAQEEASTSLGMHGGGDHQTSVHSNIRQLESQFSEEVGRMRAWLGDHRCVLQV